MKVGISRYVGRFTVLIGVVTLLVSSGPQRVTSTIFGGASLKGRNPVATLLWRVRNAPFAEGIVAKYRVLTSDDVASLDALVDKINMLGTGVHFFCQYVSSLNKHQRAFVWGVAESTDAAQRFINKYYRAQELVGTGVASGDILLRIQYVLNGYTALPVLEGYSRFITEQFYNFRKGFLIFSGDVSDALLKHETQRLYRIFRDGLPLVATCLKSLIAMSLQTDDRQVREARVTAARGIDKLFHLDSTLLALSPNAPRELLEARRGLLTQALLFAPDASKRTEIPGGAPASGVVNGRPQNTLNDESSSDRRASDNAG
ncbi:hypothetical protein TGME49_309760 [Toxoplasma gondii ME49]|uniref:Uncharacterized protein n=7 Tax=Toxoplasma gondii TaxID=5811 RepID=B6KA45_TOXGV|nr:hypothetical protein TGME49_309760 [Toxoplasma gondii ME49]ESS34791.1 hypothetical protein TGVEG_309760 [Toxoplasma gondii VEG]KFG44669.1 hypothetical protein TGDOM2_309760 [Toxoplasma gondii GAB2-2007-GAL-DOM2]KFG55730.1 hypothetical protein TGFOU_309760 [Toxoplasma gondii FOU]KYF47471.1 hypothetical protein TGARI_309760 [Toxoplasma gondii ARI]PUA91998.1 hypothetical protein TGBR9_309760 [Toxoplasma gondii TgCATBr9]RQX72349.1 hypothetical protein TGCAST_309760 [Toxoplasma gondii CAST]|eukprot:XP_002364223.1 hypothetical protein TGME49_309760 [Toxoplasma gondii ME49]